MLKLKILAVTLAAMTLAASTVPVAHAERDSDGFMPEVHCTPSILGNPQFCAVYNEFDTPTTYGNALRVASEVLPSSGRIVALMTPSLHYWSGDTGCGSPTLHNDRTAPRTIRSLSNVALADSFSGPVTVFYQACAPIEAGTGR